MLFFHLICHPSLIIRCEITDHILNVRFFSETAMIAVFSPAAFTVAPKILEALQMAESYLEKTEQFSGKVRDLIC